MWIDLSLADSEMNWCRAKMMWNLHHNFFKRAEMVVDDKGVSAVQAGSLIVKSEATVNAQRYQSDTMAITL